MSVSGALLPHITDLLYGRYSSGNRAVTVLP
jgi:hypothetical protein